MKYKGYEIEEIKDLNAFVVYYINENGFEMNTLKDTLEELKEFIDKLHLNLMANKSKALKRFRYEENLQGALDSKELLLNMFINSLNKNLQTERLNHFLKSDIKGRFCSENENSIYTGSNYENIQILHENGYKPIIKDGYKAKSEETGRFYDLKKLEYLYLEFLGLNIIDLRKGFTKEQQKVYLYNKNKEC